MEKISNPQRGNAGVGVKVAGGGVQSAWGEETARKAYWGVAKKKRAKTAR